MTEALVFLDGFQHLIAVHLRHHDVQQHEIEGLRSYLLQRLDTVYRRFQLPIAIFFEPPRQGKSIILVIINNQNAGVFAGHEPSPPPR